MSAVDLHINLCKFQIDCQLEDERSKHSENTKKYKKLITQNHKRQNNNKTVADVNNVPAADYPQASLENLRKSVTVVIAVKEIEVFHN